MKTKGDTGPFDFRFVPRDKAAAAIKRPIIRLADLSPDQRVVYDGIKKWINEESGTVPVLTVGGFAGTGKSTLVTLLSQEYAHLDIAYCAFTGKAAGVLRQKLFAEKHPPVGHFVGTLHSLMYIPYVDKETGAVNAWGRRGTLDYELVIVDEASMVDKRLFEDLLSYGVPILAVGDHGQLPPVFGDFNLMENPHLRLEKIHRQAEKSPILSLSKYIRENGDLPDNYENDLEVQLLDRGQEDEVLSSLYTAEGMDAANVGVLCYKNRNRVATNQRVREFRWADRFRADAPIIGDQVICLRNSHGTIFNGMRGSLRKCQDTTVMHYDARVLFEDDEIEVCGPICKAQFDRPTTIKDFAEYQRETGIETRHWDNVGLLFDYGYCLTVHKAQGSQFEHVIVMDDFKWLDEEARRRTLYTAVTRCQKYLVVVR